MKPILEVREIDKSFTGVHALDHVSFQCNPGTVHVLQGENGAGKSTLLKIISGLYQADSGDIFFNGEKVMFNHPSESRKKGISMVYQELTILPHLTVAQNIFLNQENKKGKNGKGLIDEVDSIKRTMELADHYGISVNPYETAGDLSIAQQQMVEILKAVSSNPQILILDEPTSSLAKAEVDKLYSIVQELKNEGCTILFISHRLEEVFRFGDDMTILKDGKFISTVRVKDVTENEVIRLMVGRELKDIFPSKAKDLSGEPIFKAENVSDHNFVHNVSLEIKKGEVLGISALAGQGQTELMEVMTGIRARTEGKTYLDGREISYKTPKSALSYGIGYVPEDRKLQALCLKLSVGDNIALSSLEKRKKAGFVDEKKELEVINAQIKAMNIRTPSRHQLVGNLSGGNQQKVSVGKMMAATPKVLFLNEPTRGIDVEAKREIYQLIRDLINNGVGVCFYSSDMMEVIGLSDRVLTIYEGRITSSLSGEDINEEKIMCGAMNINYYDGGAKE